MAQTTDISIIRQFVAIVGKGRQTEAVKLLHTLQKHIRAGHIRKTSKYADDIMLIQRLLLDIAAGGDATIDRAKFERLKRLAAPKPPKQRKPVPSQLIVVSRPAKGLAGVDAPTARIMKKAFQQYLDNYTPQPQQPRPMADVAVQGLDGVEPQGKRRLQKSDQMNSVDFMAEEFEIIPLTGRWKKLIGYPQSDSKIMFYGRPGNGKSTLALQFAGYTSKTLRSKTLYVTSEEPFSYTLQEKLKRLNVANSNLTITGEFPADVSKYKFIFIDSVNNCGMKPEDVRNLPPDHFYVYIFQTTKSGAFRGSQEYLHDVDAEIRVENMKAVAGKNRFGGYEEIDVLPPRKEDKITTK